MSVLRFKGVLLVLSSVVQMTLVREALSQAGFPSPAVMNRILDNLERVALTSAKPEERARAALTMSGVGRFRAPTPGAPNTPAEVLYPGVVARLARVYHQTTVGSVRKVIVDWMPAQAERPAAAAFLADVAAEQPPPRPATQPGVLPEGHDTAFPLPYQAIEGLTHMGPEGKAVLQRLHAEGTVREPTALAYLSQLASRDFRSDRN